MVGRLESLFEDKNKYKIFDNLLWEFYVRRKQLVNDPGNHIVKTTESTEEFFAASGSKRGQNKKPPEEEASENLKS